MQFAPETLPGQRSSHRHRRGRTAPAAGYSATGPVRPRVLSREEWQRAERVHQARATHLVEAYLERRQRGAKHAVEDFLFQYYRMRPGQLRRWHPGAGVVLVDPDPALHPRWRYYTTDIPGGHGSATATSAVTLDMAEFVRARRTSIEHVRDLLRATAANPPQFACFGLHEWAMVYQQDAQDRRHPAPLRLGAQGTDAVIESMRLRCSHYDACRFFTPAARERNELQPTRETQADFEQPGCLHAGMDLYRYAGELLPATPSEFVLDCFEHAMHARSLDMRASPYDLSELELTPVRIETASGRAEFVAAQRRLARDAARLRAGLTAICDQLLSAL